MNKKLQRRIIEHTEKASQPLITILGPTASGKTSFSIQLAHWLKEQGKEVEVVNADSRQLFKYLDIGTAKISNEEMEGVPHHLIDVLDPKEEATAGWYQVEALKVIDDILERGNFPLLVGGSMLYLSTVIDGLTLAPDPDPATRQRLIDEYEQDQGATLYKRLQELDPKTAETVHQNNFPRLIRAVEICELTHGTKAEAVPLTELRTGGKNNEQKNCSKYDTLIFGIHRERPELYDRINKRVEIMFAQGWLQEVEELVNRGYTAADPGMKSHGYREVMDYLQNPSKMSLETLQETIAAKSRQYARRQITWWKGDDRIVWL